MPPPWRLKKVAKVVPFLSFRVQKVFFSPQVWRKRSDTPRANELDILGRLSDPIIPRRPYQSTTTRFELVRPKPSDDLGDEPDANPFRV